MFAKRVAALVAVAVIVSAALGGLTGAAGMVLGIIATSVTILGWWPPIRLLGTVADEISGADPDLPNRKAATLGTSYVVVIFLVKIPIFLLLGLLARHLGGAAAACFLGGLGLVYFVLIWWLLTRDQRAA
ncbi:hypothetical protein [Fimbriimonas ginsengisoli]|uniref:Uncharacterized protein n=1 Tax=Fimbriimonas ginsengisoli Gsoil 348 TaxID=661478 RepID=A0A068NX84_FIMGI|nr:hypothetical protein [Fimbriimonas ginsengisoli]AIE88113.1 hypothetical protein OP10G_4745 [Fimbriimonas ginsengisoli Gsoil 348]